MTMPPSLPRGMVTIALERRVTTLGVKPTACHLLWGLELLEFPIECGAFDAKDRGGPILLSGGVF